MRLLIQVLALVAIVVSAGSVAGQVAGGALLPADVAEVGEGSQLPLDVPYHEAASLAPDAVVILDDIALLSVGGVSWVIPASGIRSGSEAKSLVPGRPGAKFGSQAFKAGPWVDLWGGVHTLTSSFASLDGEQNGLDHVAVVEAAFAQYPPAGPQDAESPPGQAEAGKVMGSFQLAGTTWSASSAAGLEALSAALGQTGGLAHCPVADPLRERSLVTLTASSLQFSAFWDDASGTTHSVITSPKTQNENQEKVLARHLKAVAAYQKAFPPAPPAE